MPPRRGWGIFCGIVSTMIPLLRSLDMFCCPPSSRPSPPGEGETRPAFWKCPAAGLVENLSRNKNRARRCPLLGERKQVREDVNQSFQPPHTAADVKQETEVAENLKLLADVDARNDICSNLAVQFWRDYSKSEQKSVLAIAEKFLSSFNTPTELRAQFSTEKFEKYCELAEQQLELFEIPTQFSARAREGLLGTLIIAAEGDDEEDNPYADQRIAEIHELLLKA